MTATPNDVAASTRPKQPRSRRRTHSGRLIKIGDTAVFTNPEHGEQFTGAEVLDDLTAFYRTYMALPNRHCAPVMALWAAHTYMAHNADVTPRLVFQSPEPGSGKTRGLELLELTAWRPKLTMNTSPAALFRRIETSGDHPVTILQDEFDAVWSRNASPGAEDLRALYNSGYRRGATVDRCEGDGAKMQVREFRVYAPVAMAGLSGRLPGTVETRSIIIDMQRRAPNERVGDFRKRRAAAEIEPVVSNLAYWVTQIGAKFGEDHIDLPAGVTDRAAELWEVLVFLADQAGGQWPILARAACEHFVLHRTKDASSIGIRLLADIRTVFTETGSTHMSTPTLLAKLYALPESEWKDFYGKDLTDRQLAAKLKPYDVRPHQIWETNTGKQRGYSTDGRDGIGGLAEAWERYLTEPSNLGIEAAS